MSRYYDPEVCRFINVDEVVMGFINWNTLNIFCYCVNEPVNQIDIAGYGSYSAYKKESWIFKLIEKYKVSLKKSYKIINIDSAGVQIKLTVGLDKASIFDKFETKKSFTANFNAGSLTLGWGGKLDITLGMKVGDYDVSFMRGVDWTKSYLAVTIAYTTDDDKYTGYIEAYLSVRHLLKLAIAVLVVGACVVVPMLTPAFAKLASAILGVASKIKSFIKAAIPLLALIA